MTREQLKDRWWRKLSFSKENCVEISGHCFYSESQFRQKLVQERKRAERSNKPLLVMLVNTEYLDSKDNSPELISTLAEGIISCVRDTDICGLLKEESLIGVILTEVSPDKANDTKKIVSKKIRQRLNEMLDDKMSHRIIISFRLYPETGGKNGAFDMIFYPEFTSGSMFNEGGMLIKRTMDIVGSMAALLLLFPLFTILPMAIKLTSEGPVFFIQERLGRNGRKFKLMKFRSMYVGNDDLIHRDFVKRLIEGTLAHEEATIFKITTDPRVTHLGKIMRAYSLDELPQFLNVLKGDMSLVGPRPPIHYEVENYSGWQRNRLVGKRPGITGLWQVTGRSSTTFDEMVRMDLRYLKKWSVVLDIKLILLTPFAVLRCRGAY